MHPLSAQLLSQLRGARRRTLALVDDLDEDQLRIPGAPHHATLQWSLGHVAWFQEAWSLRHLARTAPIWPIADTLFDSTRIESARRAGLDLPPWIDTRRYADSVLDAVAERITRRELDVEEAECLRLALVHEEQHTERMCAARHAHGQPSPFADGDLYALLANALQSGRTMLDERVLRVLEVRLAEELVRQGMLARPEVRIEVVTGRIRVRRHGVDHPLDASQLAELAASALHREMMQRLSTPDHAAFVECAREAGACAGDVAVPGGAFLPGADRDDPSAFDNELGAAVVDVAPFRIARAPVTQAEFAEFVEACGYDKDEHWSPAGARWRHTTLARHPADWVRGEGGRWYRRHFDALLPLSEHQPMVHVNAFEAEAWCRWAGRRLPTEFEWEFAASVEPATLIQGHLPKKRRFPWGDGAPEPRHAHVELAQAVLVDVGGYEDGDSAFGCRQMAGHVWEWTASAFEPYTGFVPGRMPNYSRRGFGATRVLRGGSFASSARVARNTFRMFLPPDRRDAFAGFRTCAQ
ncbi:MAG: ergothioneine biosynthesis protein EgtB [Planctomycetes bacterium]|nr:ergothioneine biosynthesis protein EgtB [Planctomycetota bacterium]